MISELIITLQNILDKEWDLEVRIPDIAYGDDDFCWCTTTDTSDISLDIDTSIGGTIKYLSLN